MTFDVSAGDILSVPFPVGNPSAGRRRPVLALESPDRRGDLRVAFITRTPCDAREGVALAPEDYQGSPLPLPGHVRIGHSFVLNRERFLKPLGRLNRSGLERVLRRVIAHHIPQFAELTYGERPFVAGESAVPPSGRVIGAAEIERLVEASLDGWLTTGRFNDVFERRLSEFLGRKHLLTCNSGSSANLLAVAALTSHLLGERALRPGDEVITVAAGFPTTVNPLLQYGLVPVFVDVDPRTYNALPDQVAAAVTDRTRAIVLAHTLGNPFDLEAVGAIARDRDLWLVEDCCDALGSRFQGRLTGTYGHIATFSFYPAHHITMGEGGAVATDDPLLKRALESFRDWGRDCWCDPGRDDTCRKRYQWTLGGLPAGYDHKYVYSHLGYNLKITDMQAAVGVAQLDRLPGFIDRRKANFRRLHRGLEALAGRLVLPVATPESDPAWFGFPITVREPGMRDALLAHLGERKIGTRLLFGGNLTKQPYFQGRRYRVHGELVNTDRIMNDTFWVGVYPGLDDAGIDYLAEGIAAFFSASAGSVGGGR